MMSEVEFDAASAIREILADLRRHGWQQGISISSLVRKFWLHPEVIEAGLQELAKQAQPHNPLLIRGSGVSTNPEFIFYQDLIPYEQRVTNYGGSLHGNPWRKYPTPGCG